MASDWIEHVKQYAKQNGVSYKQAMKDAKPSYKKVEGGKMKAKNVVRKTKNTVKRGVKVAKALEPFLEMGAMAVGAGSSHCSHCGAVKGGSFKAMGAGVGVQSALLGPSHPSFNPKPPKSIKKRLIEN